jgi:hypothetical protein
MTPFSSPVGYKPVSCVGANEWLFVLAHVPIRVSVVAPSHYLPNCCNIDPLTKSRRLFCTKWYMPFSF